MKMNEIIEYLEEWAPLEYQETYDNAGLIVGDRSVEVTGVLIALDSTEQVINEAIEKGANLVIAHHPILFSGLKKINGSNYVERTIIKAIKNDIAIYAIHTNLDAVLTGVNAKIAEKLGLNNCEILQPKSFSTEIGSGMIGFLEKSEDELEFLQKVKRIFKAPSLRYTQLLNKKALKIAVCGGSGSFLLSEAIRQEADVFITSDFKYHQYFDAENKIVIADIGHFEAEICTQELIYEYLRKKMITFTLHFSEVNTNPINYL